MLLLLLLKLLLFCPVGMGRQLKVIELFLLIFLLLFLLFGLFLEELSLLFLAALLCLFLLLP